MSTTEKLNELAGNLWWSWNPTAQELFSQLNPQVFSASQQNPVAALRAADAAVLKDAAFIADVEKVYDAFKSYMKAKPSHADAPAVSYFCMEYGFHESLPLYAGGLGILAGDHTKAASDLGVPFTAIGLFLRDGYFQQSFDASGMQQEEYTRLNPEDHPISLVKDENGDPIRVTVHLAHTPLQLQAWRINLGRNHVYLLDSDFDANPAEYRSLTCRLYQNGRAVRIQQEIILGIGGIRLLRALGIETDVYHMNEGHCAFLAFELLREKLETGNVLSDYSLNEAESWVRDQCVFTTHTPVMAGHDRFSPDIFLEQMAGFREQMGFSEHDLLTYGRVNPNDPGESFTMTVLALNFSRTSNGVSSLHGEVARRQWQHHYADAAVSDVPIGQITNGVHVPTWTAPEAQVFLNEKLGGWNSHRSDVEFWNQLDDVSDEELWAYRSSLRHRLVNFVKAKISTQSLKFDDNLDPDALTIGFARRFAPYKRASLLFEDLERARALFSQEDRPIQILFAGKAHPANGEGKQLIQQLFEVSRDPAFAGKLIILENYSMEIGRMLVSGTDVWLNNPRRPYEASGTSGQKVPIHGGLNLSILDGWWPEGYNGKNGWAIGHESSADYKDQSIQDAEDVTFLHDALREQVIPLFYDRNEAGLPLGWIANMREAMKTLPAAFSAERMVIDYINDVYRVSETVGA
ncbi:MAG: alpha-glucan family phosphorylase [Rhodothermales bacterium]